VYTPDIIALLEYEVSIVQDAREESMFFYVNLQDTLDIHEFYIIDEYEARVCYDDGFMTHEQYASVKIYDTKYNLHKEIIDSDDECRQ